MNRQEPPGFVHRGLICYQSSQDPLQFFYVPQAAVPDTGTGRPNLLDMGDGRRMLALEATWQPDRTAVKALEAEVVRRYPELNAALLEVDRAQPTDVTVDAMVLELADGDGLCELARSTTSGMPPYNAVFSAVLSASQAEVAAQALAGAPDLLFLTLTYALNIPVAATARIGGSVPAPTDAQLAAGSEAYDQGAALSDAEASGHLAFTLTTLPSDGIGADIGAQARDKALSSAALLLAGDFRQRVAGYAARKAAEKKKGSGLFGGLFSAGDSGKAPPPPQPQPTSISVSERLTDTIRVPASSWLTARTDIGVWATDTRANKS